jgi:uncharacterized Fe-S cluster protein YjdI
MKAQLCHKCGNCTTFALTLLGCYAEAWIWPARADFEGVVEIVLNLGVDPRGTSDEASVLA